MGRQIHKSSAGYSSFPERGLGRPPYVVYILESENGGSKCPVRNVTQTICGTIRLGGDAIPAIL